MRRSAARSTLAFALAVIVVASGARPVHAQSAANSAAAQGLFDQGKALMAQGNARDACPKFEESQRLDPGSGTLVNLALCYERTGRIASAWTTYRDAAAAARASGNVERERGARERAEALAPKVAKLVLEVPASARVEGLAVLRDGVEVGEAQWGVPIPIDEGEHVLVAKAPGHEEWRASVAVTGAGSTTRASVPPLAARAAAPAAPIAPGPAARPASEPERAHGLGTQRILALVAGGVGLAGIAVGTVFGVQALSKKNEADKSCSDTRCTTQAGADAGNDAHGAGTISTVGMVVGAVGVAGGVALWFTAPRNQSGNTQVGLGAGSVVVRGSF
jgi:hypothetical protein